MANAGAKTAPSRDRAIALGLSRYFTGLPCKHGHSGERRAKTWMCIECERMWLRLKPAEKKREYARAWRARNTDKARACDRARYAADPQNRKRHVYAWRADHPEYSTAYLEGWHQANPNKAREYTARRRGRKLAAEGSHTADDIDRIFKAQNGCCALPWCRGKLKAGAWHVDHIVPLSKDGTNWPSNIQIVHDRCNRRKSAKDPIDHARENGMLL